MNFDVVFQTLVRVGDLAITFAIIEYPNMPIKAMHKMM